MEAIVVGAGIIGLCSAYYLTQSGWQVTVIDDSPQRGNCSYGNAGMIVPSHFTPLASPGMVRQAIKWMGSRKSPFAVRPSLDVSVLRWGYRFLKSATRQHAASCAPHLSELHLFSKHLYEELAAQSNLSFSFTPQGIVMYFKTTRGAEEERALAVKAQRLGLDAGILNARELQELEPQVELNVLGGVLYYCDGHINPEAFMNTLTAYLSGQGVRIITGRSVTGMEVAGTNIQRLITSNGAHRAGLFVLAAGHRLQQLCSMAGIRVPIMPGKGYSFTQHFPQKRLMRPALLTEARVAVTPIDTSMRYAGTMELGKADESINKYRVAGIAESVQKYFPGIGVNNIDPEQAWFGFRPCSPDGLPYIGRSEKVTNAIVAGGHGMMGVSLGPATGKLVAEMANGTRCSVETSIYGPDRMNK